MRSQLSTLSPFGKARRRVTAAVLVAFTSATLLGCGGSSSVLSTAGMLDATFGAGSSDGTPDGMVSLSLGAGDDQAKAMAVQTDGKIVMVGNTTTNAIGGSTNIMVQRFNSDGSVDASFGAGTADGSPDGAVTLDLGDSSDQAVAVKIQADGKILLAGTSKPTNGTSNIILVRLTTSGALDASFGVGESDGTPDGVVSVDLGGSGDDVATAIAIKSVLTLGSTSEKIVVAGYTTQSGTKNFMIAQVNSDGTLDNTFGAGSDDGTPEGVVSLSISEGDDEANGLAVQTNGMIVVVGTTRAADNSTNAVVARLKADGSLDTAFGTGDGDGTPDGVVGISFGNGNDVANSVALQSDGKIVLVGTTTATDDSTNIAVARLNSDGTLDSAFGADTSDGTPDGVVGLSLGTGNDVGTAIVVQADGKILVAGYTTPANDTTNVAVVRLLSDGKLDTAFGQGNADGSPDGVATISLGIGNDFAYAMALAADGKILVAGDRAHDNSSDIWVARLLAN
jgi:uncharacterized delta-60 repeat protein